MKEKLDIPGEAVTVEPNAGESPPGGAAPESEDAKDGDDEDGIILHVPLDGENKEQKDFT
jgi:hypothetical protein